MNAVSPFLILAVLAQTPSSPPPAAPSYAEHETRLEFAGVRMPAVLTLPADAMPRAAVLLVPGSLFLDVDGNYPAWNVYPHAYADLARQLAGRGHAVLRYAKIGPGTGSEIFDETAARAHRRFSTRAETARAALDLLEQRVGREVPLVVAGHSEGAAVASMLASMLATDEPRIHAVVSLSGPAVGIFDIMREQIPPGTPDSSYDAFDALVADLRAGKPLPEDVGEDPGTVMFSRIDRVGVSYLVEVDAVDPARALAELGVPVLIVQGGRDASVGEHHARQLAAARGERPTEVALFPELQHFYKVVAADADPMAAFAIDTESDPAVSDAIDRFIRRIVPARRAGGGNGS